MNPFRAHHFLTSYSQHEKIADVYDDDDMLREALRALIQDFEYPDYSHKTIGQILSKLPEPAIMMAKLPETAVGYNNDND